MRIRVIYRGWEQDAVTPQELEGMIRKGQVRKFRRGCGWVDVRTDRIRRQGFTSFSGPERRAGHCRGPELPAGIDKR